MKIHTDFIQGSEEWVTARCGLLTASEMKHIITPVKLQYVTGEKEKTHLFELAAQRITRYVEPTFKTYDMRRGEYEEGEAKKYYHEHYAPVLTVGLVTNDKWGFTLGYSPDGMVGEDGHIEVKSRKPKFHLQTIIADEIPDEFMIQVQTGLMVSERPWCDFISYCGGMQMFTKRIYADAKVQDAILNAAAVFHGKLEKVMAAYNEMIKSNQHRFIPTERTFFEEIEV